MKTKIKRFKLGEYCTGGIIEVAITGKVLQIRAISDGDNKTVLKEGTTITNEGNAYFQTMMFLNDLTSSFHAGKILTFIEKTNELSNVGGYLKVY
jgi:hypothetical protein